MYAECKNSATFSVLLLLDFQLTNIYTQHSPVNDKEHPIRTSRGKISPVDNTVEESLLLIHRISVKGTISAQKCV
jgi:hypothetical protein